MVGDRGDRTDGECGDGDLDMTPDRLRWIDGFLLAPGVSPPPPPRLELLLLLLSLVADVRPAIDRTANPVSCPWGKLAIRLSS